MPTPDIALIVNATARKYERAPDLVRSLAELARGKASFHATKSLAELDAACEEAAKQDVSLVLLTGGDGSLMAGATALTRAFGGSLPKIGYFPAGTAATISRNWGLSGDPLALARRALAPAGPLRYVTRPTLRVTGRTADRADARVGFIFGTGLVAKFFDLYNADGARGNWGAARIVARIFAESFVGGPYARRVLTPLPCSIEADGICLDPKAFSLVCSSVVRDLGLHMIVTHRATEDPTRVHLVANPLPTAKLGPRMPRVLRGVPIGGEGAFDDLVKKFIVRFPNNEEGPYVLDGDMLHATEVEVSPGPALQVMSFD